MEDTFGKVHIITEDNNNIYDEEWKNNSNSNSDNDSPNNFSSPSKIPIYSLSSKVFVNNRGLGSAKPVQQTSFKEELKFNKTNNICSPEIVIQTVINEGNNGPTEISELSLFSDNSSCKVSDGKCKSDVVYNNNFRLFPEKPSSPSIMGGMSSYFNQTPSPRCTSVPEEKSEIYSYLETDKSVRLPFPTNETRNVSVHYPGFSMRGTVVSRQMRGRGVSTRKGNIYCSQSEKETANAVDLFSNQTDLDFYTFHFNAPEKILPIKQPSLMQYIPTRNKIDYTNLVQCVQNLSITNPNKNALPKPAMNNNKLNSDRISYTGKDRNQQKGMECKFCKANLETARTYTSHNLRQKIGKRTMVTCPVLRKLTCQRCGQSGDNAHTLSYCPLVIAESGKKPLSVAAELKKTRRVASGRIRKHV